MLDKKKEHPQIKTSLHPRNKHRQRYNFKQLIAACPELGPFVQLNTYQEESIDFFDPKAVKFLNKALLKYYYDIKNWDIPSNYLCPPIPGRADYIHYIADLLATSNQGKIPRGNQIKCLDIGVGANCIYPIIGNKEYQWSFIGADIDNTSIESANKIIESNPTLKGRIQLRLQTNPNDIFRGIINKNEYFDLSICNPPFHASLEEAQAAANRKLKNLKKKKETKMILNFGGQHKELYCEGGEIQFVKQMILQSKKFAQSCFWFSSLISKQSNLKKIETFLKKSDVVEQKKIKMGQGNKTSHLVAWTFLLPKQQKAWAAMRWQ